MAGNSNDKVAVAVGLFAVAASGVWLYTQHKTVAALKNRAPLTPQFGNYSSLGSSLAPSPTKEWAAAPAQKSGPEWIYDVFTPPVIFYTDGQFVVNPVKMDDNVVAEIAPFGAELINVRKNEFGIQLIGYVGSAGNFQGTFENVVSGDSFLGKSGTSIPSLGLSIKSFDVVVDRIDLPENMPLYEVVATAVLIDAQNQETTITNRERKENGPPVAIIKLDGEASTREVITGDKFTVGESEYSVQEVILSPASVVITKFSPKAKQPDQRTLMPSHGSSVSAPLSESKPVASPFGL